MRLRIDLAYDGTQFAGWARQPDQRTVQGVLEEALTRVLRVDPPVAVQVAGRTDSGVHARGQVAHADVPAEIWRDVQRPLRRLARVLPSDVRVYRLYPAPPGFHARFSALARRYTYRVCDDTLGVEPLRRREVLHRPRPLDPRPMHEAAQHLLGEHDFGAFCRRRPGATTIRTLLRFDWERAASQHLLASSAGSSPQELCATIEADAFCHSMVRALIGASLPVGEGKRPTSWPADVLARGVRDPAVPVVAAHGLCLEEVLYPADEDLGERAHQTRNLRGTPAP